MKHLNIQSYNEKLENNSINSDEFDVALRAHAWLKKNLQTFDIDEINHNLYVSFLKDDMDLALMDYVYNKKDNTEGVFLYWTNRQNNRGAGYMPIHEYDEHLKDKAPDIGDNGKWNVVGIYKPMDDMSSFEVPNKLDNVVMKEIIK